MTADQREEIEKLVESVLEKRRPLQEAEIGKLVEAALEKRRAADETLVRDRVDAILDKRQDRLKGWVAILGGVITVTIVISQWVAITHMESAAKEAARVAVAEKTQFLEETRKKVQDT